MAVEIRSVTAEEMPAYDALAGYVFGASRAFNDRYHAWNEQHQPLKPSETMAAIVDGEVASTLGALAWDVRVNGRTLPVAAITDVGTLPEHRRQGLQRRVMERALEWHHECGQAFAMLWASYGAIYQRYGYGLGSLHGGYSFDPRFAALRDEPAERLRVQRLPAKDAEARRRFEALYATYAEPRTLAVVRSAGRWEHVWHWETEDEDEAKYPWLIAFALDAEGRDRGAMLYSVGEDRHQPFQAGPDQTFTVQLFLALESDARAALWNFMLAHDLAKGVEMSYVPEDDPIVDMLVEPRVLGRQLGDGMWVRIVDLKQSLEGRGYEPDAEGSVTLTVRDELAPWNAGTWLVAVEGGSARVEQVEAASGSRGDLVLPVGALATLFTGRTGATELARAGRIEGDASALRVADRLFATAYRPHVMDGF